MIPLRSCILILLPASLLMLGAGMRGPAPKTRTRWLVDKTSHLRIEGRTNINRFCCQVSQYDKPDTLTVCQREDQPAIVRLKGGLAIDIEDFDCANRPMTKEFKKTLKYQQYPQLKISFLDISRMPGSGAVAETLKGNVEVELAGVCKRFEMDYTVNGKGGAVFDLVGERSFYFADFGLTPPSKMGGLVRVGEQLKVVFCLHLTNIE